MNISNIIHLFFFKKICIFFILIFSISNSVYAEEIDRDEVLRWVKDTYSLTSGVDAILNQALDEYPHGVTAPFLNVFKVFIQVSQIADKLSEKNYKDAVSTALLYSEQWALQQTFMRNFSSTFAIAELAVLPIRWSLDIFHKQTLKMAWDRQVKLYVHARELGYKYNHQFIMNGQDDDYILFTDDGWLYIVDQERIPGYTPGVPGYSKDTVYASALDIYNRYLAIESFQREKERIGDELRRLIESKNNVPIKNLVFSTAIVLDRSGSMAGHKTGPIGTYLSNDKEDLLKLDRAKEAAKSFVVSRADNEKISISTFSDNGEQVQDIITVGEVKSNIDLILDKITASGATNIGAGLEKGFDQLANSCDTYQKIAVLMSDGMNNRGEWETKVAKFKDQGWPVCTIAFGSDADTDTLKKIAEETGCTDEVANTTNIVNKYQSISAYVSGESTLLLASDSLPPGGGLAYPFQVTAGAEKINAYTSWQGSTLNTVLIAPDGTRFDKQVIVQGMGRSEEGSTFQMLELMNPIPGRWSVESAWSDPPQEAEQVNILVTEKTDSFVRIHGFRPQYAIGEPVTIKIDAQEQVSTGRKLPLIDPRISVEVKKPGAEMIRMVQAQSSNWTVYKDVMQDVTRDIALSDDGLHDDYRENDGIFAGTFTETDKNGPYIVSATIRGKTQSGAFVEKTSIGVFQVGSITENQVTTGQTLHYIDEAQRQLGKVMPPPEKKSPDPAAGTRQGDPLESIEALQKDDPLQSIQDLLGK